MIFDLTEILAGLVRIGVNLTDKQRELLKWRFSPEAQKYYEEKENVTFYKELMNGNISVVDAIRKEKQQRINDMKTDVLSLLLIIMIPFISSCFTSSNSVPVPDFQIIEQQWNSDSLKDKDKTYKIEEQTIKIEDESKPVHFKGNWFIVNEDFIKTFNENQDTLIKSLEKTKEVREQSEKKDKIYMYIIAGLIVFFTISYARKPLP